MESEVRLWWWCRWVWQPGIRDRSDRKLLPWWKEWGEKGEMPEVQ